uniref:Uncharacterized protein n=1 Tax=uncultured marine virus TaxID=186617 RepID=A0A0F7LB81_9VIRU|nr:hypothetical protein S18_1049_0001 [uncultured marine virus]
MVLVIPTTLRLLLMASSRLLLCSMSVQPLRKDAVQFCLLVSTTLSSAPLIRTS